LAINCPDVLLNGLLIQLLVIRMTNKITIQQQKNGQFMMTIPKGIALAVGITKGEQLELRINNYGRIELVKQKGSKN
jgi:hypothetical protein